jgi:hypothetical protein
MVFINITFTTLINQIELLGMIFVPVTALISLANFEIKRIYMTGNFYNYDYIQRNKMRAHKK